MHVRATPGIVSMIVGEAGHLSTSVLGVACFGLALAAAVYFLVTRARNAGMLGPLVVGALLRLGVMLIAHQGSLSLGEGGFLQLDDATYAIQAQDLAAHWRAGQFIDPAGPVGSYQFGFPVLIGAVYALVGSQLLAAKLVNVLAGAATVVVTGLIGKHVLGEAAGRRVAWLVALAPGVVWWSAPLFKEAVATLLVAGAILAILRLPRSWPVLSVLFAILLVVRSPSALVLAACLAISLLLAARQADTPIAWKPIAIGGLAGIGVIGVGIFLLSSGHVGPLINNYTGTLRSMFHRYQGGNAAAIPVDTVKSFLTPIPWAFDLGTRSWDRGLYPGMWVWYAVYPLAAVGCWRLRRRPELALLALTILLTILVTSSSSGFIFRQRSTVEPLILVLACAGLSSWRMGARLGSAGLAVVAVAATAQSGSAPVGLAVAAGAALLFAISRLLPDDDLLEPLPPSPLVQVVAPRGPPSRG
ncbi:MAG: hypothetical protein QOI10_1003 [Solirubrobacterales bacterium]|jgi:hypothetical protein|nr:hypothetical protein [Solirubrobacterales bacterium]